MSTNLDRRKFIGISSLGIAGALTGTITPAAAEAPHAEARPLENAPSMPNNSSRPNMILFMPDELRADSLACYGNPLAKTPNFDRLAKMGARFENCHVQFPVCGASRCSLLTGWPTSVRGHRSLAYFLRPEEPNLFRYLKESGYDVFWFGKNDALAAETFPDSVTQWKVLDGERVRDSKIGKPEGKRGVARRPDDYPRTFISESIPERTETEDYRHLSAAIRILERTQSDRPFCIFLPLTAPHPPYEPPQGFRGIHKPADITNLRPIGLSRKPCYIEAIRKEYGLDRVPEDTFRKARALYYDFVSYSDWLLGELMEAMERTNHVQDTAVFVLSDHGDYAGDYGLVEKWSSGLEDTLTHIPLLAHVPGGKPGSVCSEMTELYDVMATCLELAGVPARHTHFARSMMPQIHGAAGDPDRCAFAEGGYNEYEPQCFEVSNTNPASIYYPKIHLQNSQPQTITRSAMVRTREYKLISRSQGQSELYIYANDPQELHNRYGESSVASIQTQLQERLLHWYQNTSGIAPMDKDSRGFPPFPERPGFERHKQVKMVFDKQAAVKRILDEG